jgi:hypothetical protein
MLSVVILSVVMLSVVMLSVIMLSVMASFVETRISLDQHKKAYKALGE